MHGPLRPLQPAMDRSTARLLAAACSLSLLLLCSAGVARARAAPIGEEEVAAAFSCSAVTYTYRHFPAVSIGVHEFVSVEGTVVAKAEFTFVGPETSNTVVVHVPPGHHSMDARANWKVKGQPTVGQDIKLGGGIECGAEPGLALEKRQRVSDGSEQFTSAALSGFPGELVAYQITASNTGNVGLSVTSFADAHCDSHTIAGGPGASPVPPGASVMYSCEHTLTAADRKAGEYANTATIAATWSEGGSGELTRTSNTVLVYVTDPPPPPPPPPPPGENRSPAGGSAGTGAAGGMLGFGPSAGAPHCVVSLARRNLRVSGKGRVFVRIGLAGAGTCRGRLALAVRQRTGHGHTKAKMIASRTFSLPAGRSTVLTLALNKLGRALLHAAHGHLRATFTTLRVSPGPLSAHSASVSLSARHA
jgi:hypothetical protein